MKTLGQLQDAPETSAQGRVAGRITARITDAIKGQIAAGTLAPGAKLPSTRALSVEWGVSRTTVTLAYEQLVAEGYIELRQGTPARVAQGLGPARPTPAAQAGAPARLSAFGRQVAGFSAPTVGEYGPGTVDFRYGDLAAADFPAPAWRKAVGTVLLRRGARLRYGDPRGPLDLRTALQNYLWRARALRCTAEQVIVVNGSQQGLDLCARLLLDPGDRAILEDPGYPLARQAFQAVGAEVVPVPADADGLQTAALPAARLAFVTPSHQFPLGGVMPVGRRLELLAWAQRTGATVIEDDYDGEYRYDIAPTPALQALDGSGCVIYVGTASKTLSPTLRLGYLVVPAPLADSFAAAKRLLDRHTPTLEAEALAALIESGAYERHIRRVRRRNRERRAALLGALAAMLGDAVTVAGAEAGLHVVVWLNRFGRAQEATILERARQAGVGLYSITPCEAPGSPNPRPDRVGLVMGYASLDEPAITRGVQRLAQVLDAVVAG